MNISAHMDTLGRVVKSLKRFLGVALAYPDGGTSEQPVRKMNTSLKVGDSVGLSTLCKINVISPVNSLTSDG